MVKMLGPQKWRQLQKWPPKGFLLEPPLPSIIESIICEYACMFLLLSNLRLFVFVFSAAGTSDDRGYGYSPGPGTPVYRTDSDPSSREYIQIQRSPIHSTGGGSTTGGAGGDSPQGSTADSPRPPGSGGPVLTDDPGLGGEGTGTNEDPSVITGEKPISKPLSSGWSTALAAAGVAATMSAAANKRRTNPRNQRKPKPQSPPLPGLSSACHLKTPSENFASASWNGNILLK